MRRFPLKTVPALTGKISTVTLKDVQFALSAESGSEFARTFDYKYAFCNDTVGTSKWTDRRGVLVFALKDVSSVLPSDARLLVSIDDSHTTYPLTNGKCLVLLPSVGEGDISVEFVSDMLANQEQTFTFTVSFCASHTKYGNPEESLAPPIELTFSVSEKLVFHPDAKIVGDLPEYRSDIGMPSVQFSAKGVTDLQDRKSTRLNSSHNASSRMPSSA